MTSHTFRKLWSATLVACTVAAAAPARAVDLPPDVRLAYGELVAGASPGELVVQSASAVLAFGAADATDYRAEWELTFAPQAGGAALRVASASDTDTNTPAALNLGISRDGEGHYLTATSYRLNDAGAWAVGLAMNYYYTPYDEPVRKQLEADGLAAMSWKDRWVPMRVDVAGHEASAWIEGLCAERHRAAEPIRGPVTLHLYQGDRLRGIRVAPLGDTGLFVPVDLTHEANDRFAQPVGQGRLTVEGVPFDLPRGERDQLSLRQAHWTQWQADPADYYENYDMGPAIVHDPRTPFLRVPNDDYVAVHMLAVADDDPATLAGFTVRAGRFGWAGSLCRTWDFFASVPRQSELASVEKQRLVDTPAGKLVHVRVPLDEAFSQDLLDGFLEMELTKEVRLARRSPDPARFRTRPLGPPSGVRIAALTLERSPLRMRVTSDQPGHVFVQPGVPTFHVALQNVGAVGQGYHLAVQASSPDGTSYGQGLAESRVVEAGENATHDFALDDLSRGYHDMKVTLELVSEQPLLVRRTSLALLPPDMRQYRDRAPWGTWDFGAGHYGNPDAESSCQLQSRLGLRLVFTGTPEIRRKYHLARGIEPVVSTGLEAYANEVRDNPDHFGTGLIFHENSISYEHIQRPPELFTDWPRYAMSEAERKQFDTMWEDALKYAREFREKFPGHKLSLGNGPLPLREEFYRRGFPTELFDYAGNETANFARLPESQPPDPIANNASLWMDRKLLDAYGYQDKPIQQCYEAGYVGTNPGNVSLVDQADYYVRHALHALAWGVPAIRYAMIADVGNSYYYSNWGATGFCNRYPELNPKPAYVSFATMTLVLDGAKFVRDVPTGSPSVYVLEFERPDGRRVSALWTLRGQRRATLVGGETRFVEQWNEQGRQTPLSDAAELPVVLTPSPQYVVGTGPLAEVRPGAPEYADEPAGPPQTLSALASLDEWELEAERDPVLEFYSMMTPRRKGDFDFAAVPEFEGRQGLLRVTPRAIAHGKDTMPMYAALRHKTGIAVPGQPTEIGLCINGNSSHGRVIFELEDGTGQRWTSIGAPTADPTPRWLKEVVPDELEPRFQPMTISDWNTEDVAGLSRINFDGWRYVGFPLPGHYPGEGFKWPANSQWRHDKDGTVHYPLRLTRLIVELPEKTLHLQTFAPVPRPEIYLKDLVVAGGAE